MVLDTIFFAKFTQLHIIDRIGRNEWKNWSHTPKNSPKIDGDLLLISLASDVYAMFPAQIFINTNSCFGLKKILGHPNQENSKLII